MAAGIGSEWILLGTVVCVYLIYRILWTVGSDHKNRRRP